MHVWIDQDLCTGDGLCEEICPSIFTLVDGVSYVKTSLGQILMPGGASGLADVTQRDAEAVLEAAEECPGECIFVEG